MLVGKALHLVILVQMGSENQPGIERAGKNWRDEIPYSWTWERFICVDAGRNHDGVQEFAFYNPHHGRFLRMNGDNFKMDRSGVLNMQDLPA